MMMTMHHSINSALDTPTNQLERKTHKQKTVCLVDDDNDDFAEKIYNLTENQNDMRSWMMMML